MSNATEGIDIWISDRGENEPPTILVLHNRGEGDPPAWGYDEQSVDVEAALAKAAGELALALKHPDKADVRIVHRVGGHPLHEICVELDTAMHEAPEWERKEV